MSTSSLSLCIAYVTLVIYPTSCRCLLLFFFFFKQKTAYEMRISDWSSDVCSSDLHGQQLVPCIPPGVQCGKVGLLRHIGPEKRYARREEIGRASCRERVCQYV